MGYSSFYLSYPPREADRKPSRRAMVRQVYNPDNYYVCPTCAGTGIDPTNSPVRTKQGAIKLRLQRCPTCKGRRLVVR